MGREEASCPCKYKRRGGERRPRPCPSLGRVGLQQLLHSIWDFLSQYLCNAISLVYLNRINAIREKRSRHKSG